MMRKKLVRLFPCTLVCTVVMVKLALQFYG